MKLPSVRLPRRRQASVPEADMTLIGHLRELRSRLVRSVLAIVLGAGLVYVFHDRIFNFLAQPYCDLKLAQDEKCQFLVRTPLESFQVVLSLSGWGGLIIATPIILYQLARFVLPGLYPQERKVLYPFFGASVGLLLLGMSAGYFLMPKSLEVLSSFGPQSFTELFSPAEYMSFFIKMLLAFGLAAEFPLVLIFLQLTGILSYETLKKNRRVAFVVVMILAAVITPTGDPFTLLVVALPMYLFFEISIIVGKRIAKRRQVALTP